MSRTRHVGPVHFGVGVVSGFVLALIAIELRPADDDDVAQYRHVRDFVREAFVRETAPSEMVDDALHGMVEGLDAYSRYYNEPEVAELERETHGRYTGLGLVLRQPRDELRVFFTLPGSPADEAGLRIGDHLIEVDGQAVAALRDDEVQELLRDEDRESVRLLVRGIDGDERELTVARASIVDPTVRHERMLDEQRGIGYLAITAFSHETPGEFDEVFERLRDHGMRALVIDLRGNLGGVLVSAVEVAGRFVEHGVLVSTEGRGDPVIYEADASQALYAGFPLVLLVDESSASASEVLAGALRDHRAAVLCGTPTYGKGMVQTIRHFAEYGAVAKVTTSYYYTPSHQSLERSANDAPHGLLPDVVVALDDIEQRAVYDYLSGVSPALEDHAAIRAWERAEGVSLFDAAPPDAQLDAAVELLSGRRPGPYPAPEEEP